MERGKRFSAIILGLFILDFITKQLVRVFNIQTNNGILDITFATNTGTMWSLFSGANAINIVFIVLSFVALGFLYWYYKQEPQHSIPIAIITAGILGNLLDRIVYGAVIDWINFHWWPIFNIADSSIVIGVILLIWMTVKKK